MFDSNHTKEKQTLNPEQSFFAKSMSFFFQGKNLRDKSRLIIILPPRLLVIGRFLISDDVAWLMNVFRFGSVINYFRYVEVCTSLLHRNYTADLREGASERDSTSRGKQLGFNRSSVYS